MVTSILFSWHIMMWVKSPAAEASLLARGGRSPDAANELRSNGAIHNIIAEGKSTLFLKL